MEPTCITIKRQIAALQRLGTVRDAAAFTLGCLAKRCMRSKQFILATNGMAALVDSLNFNNPKVVLLAKDSLVDVNYNESCR